MLAFGKSNTKFEASKQTHQKTKQNRHILPTAPIIINVNKNIAVQVKTQNHN